MIRQSSMVVYVLACLQESVLAERRWQSDSILDVALSSACRWERSV